MQSIVWKHHSRERFWPLAASAIRTLPTKGERPLLVKTVVQIQTLNFQAQAAAERDRAYTQQNCRRSDLGPMRSLRGTCVKEMRGPAASHLQNKIQPPRRFKLIYRLGAGTANPIKALDHMTHAMKSIEENWRGGKAPLTLLMGAPLAVLPD